MVNNNVNTFERPTHSGIRSFEDGETWCVWAVYDRKAVEKAYGEVDDETDWSIVAYDLTGWSPYYGGPGRRFCDDPMVSVSRTRVLVTQRCGMDV